MRVLSESVEVVGLGVMGAAICRNLAARGLRVIGIDRFDAPKDRGSSHGRTRILRAAYFEHPLYVPLVQRAYQLWEDLAVRSNKVLFERTGALMIGPADGAIAGGALASAREHRLDHQVLDARELRARFPVCR